MELQQTGRPDGYLGDKQSGAQLNNYRKINSCHCDKTGSFRVCYWSHLPKGCAVGVPINSGEEAFNMVVSVLALGCVLEMIKESSFILLKSEQLYCQYQHDKTPLARERKLCGKYPTSVNRNFPSQSKHILISLHNIFYLFLLQLDLVTAALAVITEQVQHNYSLIRRWSFVFRAFFQSVLCQCHQSASCVVCERKLRSKETQSRFPSVGKMQDFFLDCG